MKVITGEEQLKEYSRDSGTLEITPRAAYIAMSESEVMDAFGQAAARGVSITPRGAGTSIPSQAVGRGFILLQERRAAKVEPDGQVVCEPGVVKADLNKILDARGVWLPVDPSSYRSCTIGGMVSNNSSGARTYKYSSTIEYVSELRTILPEEGLKILKPIRLEEAMHSGGSTAKLANVLVENEEAIRDEAPKVTKNSSGYRLEHVIHDGVLDLPRLFVGSEGTLGLFTGVTLSTLPKPSSRVLLIIETSLAELDSVASALRAHKPSAVELFDKSVFQQTGRESMIRPYSRTEEDYMVFCEFDGSEPETARSLQEVSEDSKITGFDPLVMENQAEVSQAWEVRNETLTIAADMRRGSRLPVPGVEDVIVPPADLGAIVKLLRGSFEAKGLQYISYGHAGDANLHMRPLLDPASDPDRRLLGEIMEECFEAVWRMGGSITGEHGDGMLRAPYVERQYRRTYWIMQAVKELYDPKRLLNPGVKIA